MLKEDWRERSKRGYFVSKAPEYKSLLKDESVKKWTVNLKKKAGWRTTIPSFLRTLYKFTKYSGKSPNELIAIGSTAKKIEPREEPTSATPATTKIVQDFINELLSSGKRERARHVRTCLTSFFKANGISLELEHIPRQAKKEEVILSKDQIYAMDYGRIKNQLEKNRVPIRVHITSRINKKASQVPFLAFLGTEACNALRAYIAERKRKTQKMREKGVDVRELTDNSPLFASEGKNVPFGDRMAASSIWRIIKDAAERTGLQKEKTQPNSVRKAFEAELNRSILNLETKKYFVGNPVQGMKYNIGDIERKYLICNFGRSELSKLVIVKEFVKSLGIKELEAKIRKALTLNPQMTELEAIRFIIHEKFASHSEMN